MRLDLVPPAPYRPDMDRRRFLLTSLAGIVCTPTIVDSQQPRKVARIGYLSHGTAVTNAALRQSFIDGLRQRGWTETKNIEIEYRWEGEANATFDALAVDLNRLPLDAIFAVNTPAALATKRTGTKLPVVFAQVSEPVAIGLVESLARPGTNFTGLTTINRELMSKRLEFLKETIPSLVRVGHLANPSYAVHRTQLTEMDTAARAMGLSLHVVEVRAASDFEGALARLAEVPVGAVIVQQDDLFVANQALIIALAAQRRLPTMYVFSLYPQSGGLMSYGANAADLYRRAAGHIDRILKGATPANLPVERPTKFEFVINLKAAKALGLTVPQSLLLRADHVIE